MLRTGSTALAAVILLSINLRTVFASLPPLLAEVRADFGLSAGVAGLLTTGPVLCLGLLGQLAPHITRRVPIERVLVVCGLVTAGGVAARGAGSLAALFAGTLLAGAAVAIAQVALPVLIRARHPAHVGLFTGALSLALTLGGTLAAGFAVPLEGALGSWERSLAFWALPVLIGLLPWVRGALGSGTLVAGPRAARIVGDRLAWSVSLYFALQSMAFYSGLTWLPTILRADGWSAGSAGALQAVANGVSAVPAFLLPFVAHRMRTQGPLLTAVVVCALVAEVGLLAAPGGAALWMPMLGLAQGGALGLGLILTVLRGGDVRTVAALTAMTLSVGYLIAATGPWLLGAARDLSGGWTAPLLLLIAITAAQWPVGLPGTRDRTLSAK